MGGRHKSKMETIGGGSDRKTEKKSHAKEGLRARSYAISSSSRGRQCKKEIQRRGEEGRERGEFSQDYSVVLPTREQGLRSSGGKKSTWYGKGGFGN